MDERLSHTLREWRYLPPSKLILKILMLKSQFLKAVLWPPQAHHDICVHAQVWMWIQHTKCKRYKRRNVNITKKGSMRWNFKCKMWRYVLKAMFVQGCLQMNKSLVALFVFAKAEEWQGLNVFSDCQDRLTQSQHVYHTTFNCGCSFFYIYSVPPSCGIKIWLETSVS